VRVWLGGWCVLFFIPTLQAAEKDGQKHAAQSCDILKIDPKKDENFELCSRMMPGAIQRLIAQYCVGTKEDGVCPLIVRALAWKRVVAHGPQNVDKAKLCMDVCEDDPRFMMLCDYRHHKYLPVVNSFNFDTGEHLLKNYAITSDMQTAHACLPRNGALVRWSWDEDQENGDIVFTKQVDCIFPGHTKLPPEECRLHLGEYWGLIIAPQSIGMIHRWKSSMNMALLHLQAGSIYVRWIFSSPSYELQLHANPEKPPLLLNRCWVISSDDRGCVGIAFEHQIVLFDGVTGNELMRCAPPKRFSFISASVEDEGRCDKIRTIPVPGGQKSRYELLSLVEKRKLRYREHRYLRWDIDEKTKACDMQVYGGCAGNIGGCHILPSGAFLAFQRDVDSRLIVCDSATKKIHSLWDAGWWNEFGNAGFYMHATQAGSHVLLYGCSSITKPQDTSLSALSATLLHFDPTILCTSDVQGVTDCSLLQRIRLLHGLCLAALHNDSVTLTPYGKHVFAQLHSHVRRNVQTTMSHHVYGWEEEPATVASRKPILPNIEPLENKEQKSNDSSCRIQ
jgi:hypothetical protein